MRLNRPTTYTWIIGLVLLVLAVLGHQGYVDPLSAASFWLAEGGLALMLVAAVVRGM